MKSFAECAITSRREHKTVGIDRRDLHTQTLGLNARRLDETICKWPDEIGKRPASVQPLPLNEVAEDPIRALGEELAENESVHLVARPLRLAVGHSGLFRDACKAAGVPGSAHGVRKIAATRAAENGATVAELEAIFGCTAAAWLLITQRKLTECASPKGNAQAGEQ